jgi:hypothetical protein
MPVDSPGLSHNIASCDDGTVPINWQERREIDDPLVLPDRPLRRGFGGRVAAVTPPRHYLNLD